MIKLNTLPIRYFLILIDFKGYILSTLHKEYFLAIKRGFE